MREELPDRRFQRRLASAKQIVGTANSDCPVVPARDAVDLIGVTRRNKSARRIVLSRRVAAEVVITSAVGQRQAIDRPLVLREQPEVGIRRRYPVDVRVSEDGHVAMRLDFDRRPSPFLIHAGLEVVRAGDVRHVGDRVPDLVEVVLRRGGRGDRSDAGRPIEVIDV